MKKKFLFIVLGALIALYSCGGGGSSEITAGPAPDSGGGGGGVTTSGSGDVALFVTDDISDYLHVNMTINTVEILNKGTGISCALLSDPVELDIAELSSEILLLDVASCPDESYNRISVETARTITVTDSTEITSTCDLVSYKDQQNRPNVLQCNADNCSLEINGQVNVMAKQNNTLTLDFDLKEFEVENFGGDDCTVTMKVEPLNSNDVDEKKQKGTEESIKGFVTEHDAGLQSFTLVKKDTGYDVSYGAVEQEGLDELITLALDYHLMTKVRCSELDIENNLCTASEIYVNVEGTVSELNETDSTFLLTFNPEICVDYTDAEVEGELADGAEAEAKLNGYNGDCYLAVEVEAEEAEDSGDGEGDDNQEPPEM